MRIHTNPFIIYQYKFKYVQYVVYTCTTLCFQKINSSTKKHAHIPTAPVHVYSVTLHSS